ncbi:MAG: hypothetical protein JW839_06950 [Candidatus Lokiarchaeota archaeon]|nr:hypothetical protein [Candidatus Lokiarchaeota archaeon]
MNIGKIIRGENQVTYLVQVENSLEGKPGPAPEDCAFGNYVKVISSDAPARVLVGLVIDSALVDRDSLRAGPRLAPDFESMNVLFPDFVDERIKVVRIFLIGSIDGKATSHDFPGVTPKLGDVVVKMADAEIKGFHLVGGQFKVGYYSQAMQIRSPFTMPLMIRVFDRLGKLFPDQVELLALLKSNLEYALKMQGGFSQ